MKIGMIYALDSDDLDGEGMDPNHYATLTGPYTSVAAANMHGRVWLLVEGAWFVAPDVLPFDAGCATA